MRLGLNTLALWGAGLLGAQASNLPIVDLGYEQHQAITFNQTGQYYNFTNIRYAAAPLGDLRFAPPIPPTGRDSSINNGSVDRICPQVSPCWALVQNNFNTANLSGNAFDFEAAAAQSAASNCTIVLPSQDPATTEDCLFLDVHVPKAVFDGAQSSNSSITGAAVIVWIYGGGFFAGSKSFWGDPAGLVDAGTKAGDQGFVFVAFNYRLGTLGWLAGPDFVKDGGTANLGVYDVSLALQWVKDNIHLFGGDPDRVTVMGQSAGGSSIIFQMTAWGGTRSPPPFQQALTFSPAYAPSPQLQTQNDQYHRFLELLNVSTLAQARNLPSEKLIYANYVLGASSPYGTFTIGPTVDGQIIPDDPKRLLLRGYAHSNVSLITSHGSNEGFTFTPPNVTDDATFTTYVRRILPGLSPAGVDYVTQVLYPDDYSGTQPWTTPWDRAKHFMAESAIICNAYYLNAAAAAHGRDVYSYQFDVFPGAHGQDIPYFFYNGVGSNGPSLTYDDLNGTLAGYMQRYYAAFTQSGDPNNRSGITKVPMLEEWNGRNVTNLSNSGYTRITDPLVNQRCEFWQTAPWQ